MHSSAISEPDLVDCETQEPAHAATALHYAQLMLSWRMRHANKDLTHLVVTDQGLVEREGAGRAARVSQPLPLPHASVAKL